MTIVYYVLSKELLGVSKNGLYYSELVKVVLGMRDAMQGGPLVWVFILNYIFYFILYLNDELSHGFCWCFVIVMIESARCWLSPWGKSHLIGSFGYDLLFCYVALVGYGAGGSQRVFSEA